MSEAWEELADRMNNIYISENFESTVENYIEDNKLYFQNLFDTKEEILKHLDATKSQVNTIECIFKIYFNCVINSIDVFKQFISDEDFIEDCYDAFIFLTLCLFLSSSKKCKAKTMNIFVRDNSNDKSLCKDTLEQGKDVKYTDLEENNAVTIRQYRKRLNETRQDYYARKKWASMPLSSEIEWSYYFKLSNYSYGNEKEQTIYDTFKRIGNLYSDIRKIRKEDIQGNEHKTNENVDPCSKVSNAFKRFKNKLEKLSLQNAYDLYCDALNHISSDKKYFGINLYRFEREFRYYELSQEVDALLKLGDERSQVDLIKKFYSLSDVVFPDVVLDIACAEDCYMDVYCDFFTYLSRRGTLSCELIIDEFIDKGYKDWEDLFCNIVNEKTYSVLYDPSKIDFPINAEAEMAFKKILTEEVLAYIESQGIVFAPMDSKC